MKEKYSWRCMHMPLAPQTAVETLSPWVQLEACYSFFTSTRHSISASCTCSLHWDQAQISQLYSICSIFKLSLVQYKYALKLKNDVKPCSQSNCILIFQTDFTMLCVGSVNRLWVVSDAETIASDNFCIKKWQKKYIANTLNGHELPFLNFVVFSVVHL